MFYYKRFILCGQKNFWFFETSFKFDKYFNLELSGLI